MPKIIFQNENTVIDAQPGESVLAASRRCGIIIDSPCNGSGTCGKCKIRIAGAETLACQTFAGAADLVVETVAHRDTHGLKILAGGTALQVQLDAPVLRDMNLPPESPVWGAAVDIGTTTLVVALVDLRTGEELATVSSLNPQARHAQDVLSRITFAAEAEGLELLRREIIDEIDRLIAEAAQKAAGAAADVYEAVFSGNTTMVYLALGIPPATLGKFPYRLTERGGSVFPAAARGLHIAAAGHIYVPPLISAYVGADITSGILVTELEKLPGTTLFIDIGTNGEMSLARDGQLAATSTAAGPAFEGMNISCGMRAAPGAIERVTLADGEVQIQTIGDAPPIGICGSGLLDAIGEIVRGGAVDRNGRFRPAGPWEGRFRLRDGKPVFCLAGGDGAPEIFLTQKDIRQVQLAKAAVRAGIELMLRSSGVAAAAVDRVLIAGSFGFHLKEESLLNLELLPAEFAGKVHFSGNTSKTGAIAFLLNGATRSAMAALAGRVQVLELANDPDFQNIFVKAMGFSR